MNGPKMVPADQRVTAYKQHAHIYCQMLGENPEEVVQVPHPQLAGVSTAKPYWYIVAERMLDLAVLLRAMSEGNARAQSSASAAAREHIQQQGANDA